MQKTIIVCAIAGLACGLDAAELPVDGTFTEFTPDHRPVKWQHHDWQGFKPFAEMTVQEKGDNRANILSIREIKSRNGNCIRSRDAFTGKAGDAVRLTFRAKGKGTGNAALILLNSKKQWSGIEDRRIFKLEPEWNSYEFLLPVKNGRSGETAFFNICFNLGKNAEMDLSSVKAEWLPGRFKGVVTSLNGSWMLNAWKGYQPRAEMTELADSTIIVRKVTAKYGFGINSRKNIPIKPGSTVKMTASVSGKGTLYAKLTYCNAGHKSIGTPPQSKKMELTPAWQEITLQIPVEKFKNQDPAYCNGCFTMGNGCELALRNCDIEIIPPIAADPK